MVIWWIDDLIILLFDHMVFRLSSILKFGHFEIRPFWNSAILKFDYFEIRPFWNSTILKFDHSVMNGNSIIYLVNPVSWSIWNSDTLKFGYFVVRPFGYSTIRPEIFHSRKWWILYWFGGKFRFVYSFWFCSYFVGTWDLFTLKKNVIWLFGYFAIRSFRN